MIDCTEKIKTYIKTIKIYVETENKIKYCQYIKSVMWLTLCNNSKAYSKPAVRLAALSFLADLTAAFISRTLSGVART